MNIILIAAVTANGKIARHANEELTWTRDLKLFKEQTMGQTVIIGSNTAKTLWKELEGRQVIVMHRDRNPEEILSSVKTKKCFIAGGSRTNSHFIDYLTHIYLTIHPLVFKENSIPLFYSLKKEIILKLDNIVEIDKQGGIFQYQYLVI